MSLPFPWFVVGDIHLYAKSHEDVALDLEALLHREVLRAGSNYGAVVFNGDTFDLDRAVGPGPQGLKPERVIQCLQECMETFSGLFHTFRQVAATTPLVFVAGNHDAQLLVPAVQQFLVQQLGNSDRVRVVERLMQDGCLVEHGHQVDPDAAFFPNPTEALQKFRVTALPLASLISRELLSHIPKYCLAGDNRKVPVKVLWRVVREYGWSSIPMILRYPVAGMRIWFLSFKAVAQGDAHARAFVTMGTPMVVAARLYVSRYFGTVFLLALGGAWALGVIRPWYDLRAWTSWWALFLIVLLAIPPFQNRVFANRDIKAAAERARQAIGRGATAVVLGHTHTALAERVDAQPEGAWEGQADQGNQGNQGNMGNQSPNYVNHGAFFDVQHDPEGSYRTYVVLDAQGPRLEKYRLDGSLARAMTASR